MNLSTKTKLIIIGIALVLISVIFIILNTRQEKVSISDADASAAGGIAVDFSKNNDLLTTDQQLTLRSDLLKKTVYPDIPDGKIEGVVRSSSIKNPSKGETVFIIDSPAVQTSYLISRYVSPEDSTIDIVNITCLAENQRVYKKDYCYEQ